MVVKGNVLPGDLSVIIPDQELYELVQGGDQLPRAPGLQPVYVGKPYAVPGQVEMFYPQDISAFYI